jgi:enolase
MLFFLPMSKIKKIHAREVIDSRGFPTVEAECWLESGEIGMAIVPSGASTGSHEALELRDADPKRFLGKGVLKAVDNINKKIAPALVGRSVEDLKSTDKLLIDIDGTPNKTELGANALLAVSLACAKTASVFKKITLAQWINEQAKALGYVCEMKLPIPLMNVINGGAHADNGLDIQEFMLVPHGFGSFRESLRAGCEVFHHLKKNLSSQGLTVAVGDEGGFAPRLEGGNRAALVLLMEAIEKAGFVPGKQISLALDVASTEFFDSENELYKFKDKKVGSVAGKTLCELYLKWANEFPLVSIEDGFAEDDWASWISAKKKNDSQKIQWVGDDLFVTQVSRLKEGIEKGAGSAILIKLNQVGTLYESLLTMKLAAEKGYRSVVSHRSGESEDTTLAHLAVGTGAGQVKTGSLSRSDRVAKYNELLRLEEHLRLRQAKIF